LPLDTAAAAEKHPLPQTGARSRTDHFPSLPWLKSPPPPLIETCIYLSFRQRAANLLISI
jgi:hypothetical protein